MHQAIKDVSASYETLVHLFGSIENFLSRLDIYTKIPPTQALTDILVKIMVELLSTLALATKEVKRGRLSELAPAGVILFAQRCAGKFLRKLRGENNIEAMLQNLDRLTLDEVRATSAQTLQVVTILVQQGDPESVTGGGEIVPSLFLAHC